MRLVRLWLVCTCAAVLFLPAHVTSWGRQNAGEAWAQSFGGSLDGQPGARENALGGAGVALIGDPSDAVWWNPAALGFARTASGQVTHGFANEQSPWPLSTRDDNASGAIPLGSLGGIGFCLTDLSYPSYHSQIDYSYFRPSYLLRGGSVGLHFFSNLAVGATVKWIQIELRPYDIVSETFGADLGALYRVPLDRGSLSFGMNVQNLGPDVTLYGEDEKSPLNRNLKVGAVSSDGRYAALVWGTKDPDISIVDLDRGRLAWKVHLAIRTSLVSRSAWGTTTIACKIPAI